MHAQGWLKLWTWLGPTQARSGGISGLGLDRPDSDCNPETLYHTHNEKYGLIDEPDATHTPRLGSIRMVLLMSLMSPIPLGLDLFVWSY